MAATIERRIAVVLCADVVGYSRLMGRDEEGTLAALNAVRRDIVDPKIADHRGRTVRRPSVRGFSTVAVTVKK